MHIAAYSNSGQYSPLYTVLQLLLAGLYAFVLPFICWGAQATPGHPHAQAHFVFVEPQAEEHHLHLMADGARIHPLSGMSVTADHGAECYLHHAHAAPVDDPQVPAGRSVPPQLAISELIPLRAVMSLLPPIVDGGGFSVWLPSSISAPFYSLVPTPPPR